MLFPRILAETPIQAPNSFTATLLNYCCVLSLIAILGYEFAFKEVLRGREELPD
jgi:hypothetical protein